jgi:hypothetical protein
MRFRSVQSTLSPGAPNLLLIMEPQVNQPTIALESRSDSGRKVRRTGRICAKSGRGGLRKLNRSPQPGRCEKLRAFAGQAGWAGYGPTPIARANRAIPVALDPYVAGGQHVDRSHLVGTDSSECCNHRLLESLWSASRIAYKRRPASTVAHSRCVLEASGRAP